MVNNDICEDIIEVDEIVTVTATVYQATPAQCNEDHLTTAFGYKIDSLNPLKHRYMAVSRDLEEYLSKGDSVEICGTEIYDGTWIVADRMNNRWCNRIDLLVNMDSSIGKFENVTIVKQ